MKMGVHRPIIIPKNDLGDASGKASYITPDSDINAIYDYIDKRVIHVINSMGISAQSYRSDASSFSSGYQLKLSKLDVIKKNKGDRQHYTESIKELCQLMMQCVSLFDTKKRYPENLNIEVDYAEIKFDEDPLQKEQVDASRLANGLTSRPRLLMERNPDLTLEDAIELYKEIKAENDEFGIGDKLEEFNEELT